MTQDEHIVRLLTGKLFNEWMEKHNFNKIERKSIAVISSEIGKNLPVTEQEIYEYLLKNGFPENIVNTERKTFDGIYLVRDGDKVVYFEQERGQRHDEAWFDEYDVALRYCVHELVKLYFS